MYFVLIQKIKIKKYFPQQWRMQCLVVAHDSNGALLGSAPLETRAQSTQWWDQNYQWRTWTCAITIQKLNGAFGVGSNGALMVRH